MESFAMESRNGTKRWCQPATRSSSSATAPSPPMSPGRTSRPSWNSAISGTFGACKKSYRRTGMRDDALLRRIIEGRSDANIRFDALRSLLLRLGFAERIRGSHHHFRMSGVPDRINLQRDGSQVKPYQVQQVRRIIVKHKLGEAS